jgi:hypothetical protein
VEKFPFIRISDTRRVKLLLRTELITRGFPGFQDVRKEQRKEEEGD